MAAAPQRASAMVIHQKTSSFGTKFRQKRGQVAPDAAPGLATRTDYPPRRRAVAQQRPSDALGFVEIDLLTTPRIPGQMRPLNRRKIPTPSPKTTKRPPDQAEAGPRRVILSA